MKTNQIVDITILIYAKDTKKELRRTLRALKDDYQKKAENFTWEIIVLDDNPSPSISAEQLGSILPGVKVVHNSSFGQSAFDFIKQSYSLASGKLIGLWTDASYIASPGTLHHAYNAWLSDSKSVIGLLSFQLGFDVHSRSVLEGFTEVVEQDLLKSVSWLKDGYKLFDISVLEEPSNGWFGCLNNCNVFFLDRELFSKIINESLFPENNFSFSLWKMAVDYSKGNPWIILGEAVFKQCNLKKEKQNRKVPTKSPDVLITWNAPKYIGTLDEKHYSLGTPKVTEIMRRAHSVRGRKFQIDLSTSVLGKIQNGTMRTKYKGLRLAKNPFDLALYSQVIQSLRPQSIIEVGTSEGGSAIWLIDQCFSHGLSNTHLHTIDIKPPALTHEKISFYEGDSIHPDDTFPTEIIKNSPHPWLVIEDSAHTYESVKAALEYFDKILKPDDVIVIEDGCVADLVGKNYRSLDDGPNRAVREFLLATEDRYEIDSSLCDFYGHNVTYAPNAWLRRIN
ncbi:hypothetical protein C4K68_13880 [Pokkaliibacter plantistimulans]|uniref:Uncharacterized protein n=1 Tax=Proteobacteria bacterium 228 TaxID=2083153 RepID=A0A2S5KPH5_9PROT|nr:CmcI family methyltransferase [Pokkaliibacter plantistimulans]PPC76747.1 hypothetical protein C4K68_13880 [Pokkaliibacter plantistimulans]